MRLVQLAQEYIGKHIGNGSIVIDLTCGNGKDSVFLAQKIGTNGKLYSFDIQENAIEETKNLLLLEDCISQAHVILRCHAKFTEAIPSELKGMIDASMINLGYLPKGDHAITTKTETTITAILKSYEWLSSKGVMTILAYRGHPGGEEENLAVRNLISEKKWNCKTKLGIEQRRSPILYMISKD